jgi:hypothetical protein
VGVIIEFQPPTPNSQPFSIAQAGGPGGKIWFKSKEEQTGGSRRRPSGGRVSGPKKRGETRAGGALGGVLTPLRVEHSGARRQAGRSLEARSALSCCVD